MQYKLDNTVINPFDSGDPVFNVPGLMDVVPNAPLVLTYTAKNTTYLLPFHNY